MFCPDCNSILDISKTSVKKAYNLDMTPSSISETDDDKIKIIIEKIIKNDEIENIENVKLDQIVNHDAYLKLDKQKRTALLSKIEILLAKQDDMTGAFYICKTCSYSKKIEPETKIATKIGISSQTNYLNKDKFKNKIYNRALPFTRRYICPNNSCIGNTDKKKHEAVMYRVGDTMKMMYTCCACKTVW